MAGLTVERSRSGAFVRFWIADAVSNLGTFVSALALQLLLIETLHADQTALGVVRAATVAALPPLRHARRRRRGPGPSTSPPRRGRRALCRAAGRGRRPCADRPPDGAGPGRPRLLRRLGVDVLQRGPPVAPPDDRLRAPDSPPRTPASPRPTRPTQSLGPLVGGALVRLLSAPVAVLVDADVVCRVGPRADDRPCRGAASRARPSSGTCGPSCARERPGSTGTRRSARTPWLAAPVVLRQRHGHDGPRLLRDDRAAPRPDRGRVSSSPRRG